MLAMAAKRDANWGFMAEVAAAAMVAELALMGFFCSSLCCFPRRQSAGLWTVHAIWCSHQLKVYFPTFLPSLLSPALGGSFREVTAVISISFGKESWQDTTYQINLSVDPKSPVYKTIDMNDWEEIMTLYGQIEGCVENKLNDIIYNKYGCFTSHVLITST